MVSTHAGDHGQHETPGDERNDHPAMGQRRTPALAALITAQRTQLTMIGLHVTVQLTSIIRNLDVYSGQAVIIVSRFTAIVHASLRKSLTSSCLQYEPGTPPA